MAIAILFPPSLGRITAAARAELLAEWLGKRIGEKVEVRVAKDYEELELSIRESRVHLAWAPPAICARVQPGATAIFKAVRAGRSMYHGALVARRGELRSIAAVVGRRAAWVDKLATSGYLLARAFLRAEGIDPDRDLKKQRFMGSYGTAVRSVLNGDNDFTSIYSHEPTESSARASLRELVGKVEKEIDIIGFTEASPTDGLIVTDRPGSDETLRRLQEIITEGAADVPTLMLAILDADRLEAAEAADYDALRSAM